MTSHTPTEFRAHDESPSDGSAATDPSAGTITFGRQGRPVRLAFVGDESLVVACAEIAGNAGAETVAILSRNRLVLDAARQFGIESVDLGELPDVVVALQQFDFDVLVSAANRHILPSEALAQAELAVNFHDGPLPGYAGLNVTTWAIENGESEHGVTWHLMTDDVDSGAVVASDRFAVGNDDTAFALNTRCYEAATATFADVASSLAGGAIVARPQTPGETKMYRRRDRPVAVIDPRGSCTDQVRHARALDVGSRVTNEVGLPYLLVGDEVFLASGVSVDESEQIARPGTVAVDDAGALRLACADGWMVVSELWRPEGEVALAADVVAAVAAQEGGIVAPPDERLVAALTSSIESLAAGETAWRSAMSGLEVADPPLLAAQRDWSESIELGGDGSTSSAGIATCLLTWWQAVSGADDAVLAVTDPAARARARDLAPLLREPIVRITIADDDRTNDLADRVERHLTTALDRGPFLADVAGRDPDLREAATQPLVRLDLDVDPGDETQGGAFDARGADVVRVAMTTDGRVTLRHRLEEAGGARVAEQLATLLAQITSADAASGTPVTDLQLVGSDESRTLDALNDTATEYDREATIDRLFASIAATRPDDDAVSAGGRTLTYGQLARAVEHLGAELDAAGVEHGDVVAIAVERGLEMITSVLAVLARGATYLPLDPDYPVDRLQFMVDDSQTRFAIARPETAGWLQERGVTVIDPVVDVDGDPSSAGVASHTSDGLAYLIYTSGSTGKPKGVQLEHRNVVNFFVAMDQVIDHDPPGVWLAVTSLSFDISVLELLWTLTRGFHVVIKAESGFGTRSTDAPERLTRPVSMSMFYFAADPTQATDGYRLLLETAKWADRQGFEAVWIPERHFHDFGAPYANPSVAAAALAVATEQIAIRAGSVVLPLHSPIRVAEEWSMVDNLSGGRVGISFAAGWQPNDFVLNPAAYATSKESLPGLISTVEALWRGESVDLPGHDGESVSVSTLPRPVQDELPIWLTSAGSTSTFERAGRLGKNVLTHLLGQSIDQLAANIARYREEWKAAGHQGEGHVTLMLHTYLDADADVAREVAREPLKGYLSTAVGLLKDMASSFPTFANSGGDADAAFKALTEDEMSQLLDMAAERYLSTSGLFGGVDDAIAMVRSVAAAGADEVACLVDFGVDTETVIGSLDLIGQVHDRINEEQSTPPEEPAEPETVADLVARYGVTHLQCTPSLAAMLVANPPDRAALGSVRHMMVGGEALPVTLAGELQSLIPSGRLTNMYGPTETTIWSLVHEVDDVPDGSVPIGRAIANNTVFVLDRHGRRVPLGVFGELHIGGDGVARGYHDRPELTAERFVDRSGLGRLYATGDIVRAREDGLVEFGGRTDHQVKIRGHRIELGEIETVIDRDPDVSQSVVVARGAGEPTLVAFVSLNVGASAEPAAIRERVAATLPGPMVPSVVVVLDALPLTPNGKIDRKRLPDATPGSSGADATPVAEMGNHEQLVAGVWAEELGRDAALDDNFFDIGGHSLLAVKVFKQIADRSGLPISLTDVFRYPTIRSFADFLDSTGGGDGAAGPATSSASAGAERAKRRRRTKR